MGLDNISDLCYGLSMSWEVLTLNVGAKSSVYECESGLYSYYNGDTKYECLWQDYQPINYIYTANYYKNLDGINEITPWTCL